MPSKHSVIMRGALCGRRVLSTRSLAMLRNLCWLFPFNFTVDRWLRKREAILQGRRIFFCKTHGQTVIPILVGNGKSFAEQKAHTQAEKIKFNHVIIRNTKNPFRSTIIEAVYLGVKNWDETGRNDLDLQRTMAQKVSLQLPSRYHHATWTVFGFKKIKAMQRRQHIQKMHHRMPKNLTEN